MGPLLWKDGCTLYLPGNENSELVPDYYRSELKEVDTDSISSLNEKLKHQDPAKDASFDQAQESQAAPTTPSNPKDRRRNADLRAVDSLPWAHPRRIYATVKLGLTYGITRDVIGHQSKGLEDVHRRAVVYDNKVEHLWTTAQVLTAMLMSVAHGANDISNAIGPFTTEYETWSTGVTSANTDTPTWIKAVGGLGLGLGFWTFGYHIMRNLGNRITKHSPTRGYSMELAAAITVLLATRLGLPVSTTQCITGAIIGVAFMNRDLKSIHWRQLGKIFLGWVLTVPCAGLISGIIMGIALNVPRWGPGP
jgi:solute carrier family 20 (sodium-dependent phosphate transporter)